MSISSSSLPSPEKTYFFRNPILPAVIHECANRVSDKYSRPHKIPIAIIFDGDFRAKDSFSLRCVDVEAAIQKGIPETDALSVVSEWRPIIRRDIYPDDLGPDGIQYEPDDIVFIGRVINGDKSQEGLQEELKEGLSCKAAKRAKKLLGEPLVSGKTRLSDKFIRALGPLQQVDVSDPSLLDKLPAAQRVPQPNVHSSQNIWAYLDPGRQDQFAKNLQATQSEGSFLVLGTTEAAELPNLGPLLQRHGYAPYDNLNEFITDQMLSNPILASQNQSADREYTIEDLNPFVYQKTQVDPTPKPQKLLESAGLKHSQTKRSNTCTIT